MDTTQGTQAPRTLRRASLAVITFGLGALLSASVFAGPVNPAHRFESIGQGVENTSAILAMPGSMRALVLLRTGEMHLVCGDGLVNEPVGTIDVAGGCPEKGLLGGVWAPDKVGEELYITYVSEATGNFTVGRVTFGEGFQPGPVETVYQALTPAPCDNLGGGIAFHPDGTLLVGTGDFGNPAGAGLITAPVGKVLRFTTDGLPPQSPLELNPFGASPTYAMGCRNPVRLMTDSETGVVWFLDQGPGDNDELNRVGAFVNYGWNGTMTMGRTGTPGDPFHVWSPGVGPAGLNVYRGDNFKNVGHMMVAASDGFMSDIRINQSDAADSWETILYAPEATGPQAFKDLTVLPDGMIYVVDELGNLWRLVNGPGTTIEPSSRSSIVPTLATRMPSGDFSIAGERSAGMNNFGLYVGDLMTLAAGGYNHGVDLNGDGLENETADMRPVDFAEDDAWSRFDVGVDELTPDRGAAQPGADGRVGIYFLLSGDSTAIETGVGFDSIGGERPGGLISKTCIDCAGAPFGNQEGNCSTTWELDTYGIAGAGNVLGPVEFTKTWDCDVVLLSISAEWCGPCRFLASSAEALYQAHVDRGFTIVDVLFENTAGDPTDAGVVDRWAADFGLTHPVIHDDNYLVWDTMRNGGSIPQSFVVNCKGLITDWILGADPGGIETAVERQLDLGLCD